MTKKLILLLLSFSLYIQTSSCAFLHNGSIRDKIDYYLQYYTDANLFSGAVLVAKEGNIIIEKGYGYADRKSKTQFTANTKIKLASVSKLLTAIAIMKLYQNGQLDLQDKIIDYFSRVNVNKNVTLHHLLSMSSGFNDVIRTEIQEPNFLAGTLDKFYTREQIDNIVENNTIKTEEEGISYSYNNTNYYLLGRVVEIVSGQTLDTYLQNNLFIPLGMNNSFIADGSNDNMTGVSVGHTITPYGLNYAEEVNESYAFGYASGISTVHDFYLLDESFYTTTILTDANKDLMFRVQTPAYGDEANVFESDYGYGVSIDDTFSINGVQHKVIHHGGNFMGYSNYYARFPNDHIVIILFSNIGEYTARESMVYDIASIVFE